MQQCNKANIYEPMVSQSKIGYRSRLRECRLKAAIGTQQELARLTGIDRTTISAIERGRLFLSSRYALVFREILRCSLDDFYEEVDMIDKNDGRTPSRARQRSCSR